MVSKYQYFIVYYIAQQSTGCLIAGLKNISKVGR